MPERLSILLADDEDIIRRKVCMLLADKFRVVQASTAMETRAAPVETIDAVLLDIVFPDGNGIELCREIKQRNPHCTVIISSSMETVEAWDQAFQAGADGYLEKRELLGLNPNKISLMITNLVERNRLRKQTEELNRRQAAILAVLSHDVRAPFQALLGTIEQLRKSQISPAAAKNVETLYECAKDQLSFINSLLELLRLESGAVGLRLYPISVNLAVNMAIQTLSVLASAKKIEVITDLDPTLTKIDADPARISQLAGNLLTNAVKFTPRGGVIKVRTGASSRNGIDGVAIVVEDNGIGISKEERNRIFDPFHIGREKGTEGEKGSGLGLSICREIVQLHGGRLEVDSAIPKGTVFTAWFPVSSNSHEQSNKSGVFKNMDACSDVSRRDSSALKTSRSPASPVSTKTCK